MTDAKTSAELYRARRERATSAVHELDSATLNQVVTACPQWTVHNLVSHLTGVAADFLVGNLMGRPARRTAVQVDNRRTLPIDAVLNKWAASGPALGHLVVSGTTSQPLICNPWVDTGPTRPICTGRSGLGVHRLTSGPRRSTGCWTNPDR